MRQEVLPVFSCVRVGDLLLSTLLSLGKTLVLTNSLGFVRTNIEGIVVP